MNNITDVQEGLYNQLLLTVGLPADVERENSRFKPDLRNDWVRVTLLPSATTKETIGLNGWNRLNGLYQIDIFTAAGRKPIADMNTLADSIINNYTNQLYISENTTNIQVIDSWRDTSVTESDWFKIIVFVRWESRQTR